MIDVRGKSVFISGPMSGKQQNNLSAFVDAHQRLLEMGADRVYDPAKEWLDSMARGESPRSHEFWMRRTIGELARNGNVSDGADWYVTEQPPKYDLMVQLEGWRDSQGCMTENEVARACGISVVEIGELDG